MDNRIDISFRGTENEWHKLYIRVTISFFFGKIEKWKAAKSNSWTNFIPIDITLATTY